MALTDIESVKRILGKEDGLHDDLLLMIVEGVSARMERYIGRIISMEEYVSEPVESVGFAAIVLDHGPVTNVITVIEGTGTLVAADYRLEGDTTLIRLAGGIVVAWPKGTILVTYEAGYDDVPEDLDWACSMQSAREYGFTNPGSASLGVKSTSPTQASGESTTYEMNPWLPQVLSTMNQFRTII